MSTISTRPLDCGATLVVEAIPTASSSAVCWMLPAGAATDPPDRQGASSLFAEMLFRGADGLDSRTHSDALDRLGVQRGSYVGSRHLVVDATLLGSRLEETIPLLAGMVRRPALEAGALDPVRSLCLQALAGLDDDPQRLCGLRLREQHLAPPFDRHGYGQREHLETIGIEELRSTWPRRATPRRSILGLAGNVDADAAAAALDRALAGWTGDTPEPVPTGEPRRGQRHFAEDSAQVHLGVAYDAPAAPHEDAMLERLAVRILGGASSSRLFTEVREKRGLCYSVGASYRATRDAGYVSIYAGSTPDRGQETLDVIIDELRRLGEGVDQSEFASAVVGLKSRLVMQGESTAARAAAIAGDTFRHGRPRSLQEVAAEVDAITLDALNAYLSRRLPGALTLVAVGPAELRAPMAVA
jgi:predicted Zn-dependent peptidase